MILFENSRRLDLPVILEFKRKIKSSREEKRLSGAMTAQPSALAIICLWVWLI
jgi:hypothetical protein